MKERKVKELGYIKINDKLRIRVETDNLTIEELIGENVWGNNKYFTSWDGVMSWIIKRFTTEKLGKKKTWEFLEAKKEILSTVNEVKNILIGEISDTIELSGQEIKDNINKFNI